MPASARSERSLVTVSSVNLQAELVTLSREDVLAILPAHVGDTISLDEIEDLKNKLLKTSLFETVEIETKRRGKKVSLNFFIKEARLIRKVSVSGNYPYLAKRILRLSSLQTGDPFRADLLPESEQRLKQYFEKQGHFNTQVSIETSPDDKKNMVNLKIRIKKGKSYRIGHITVSGNTYFNDSYIRNKLFSWTHFRLKKIRKQIKNIQKVYIKKGFVRARVKLESARINPKTNRIDLHIRIKERKRLDLRFKGNRWFKPQTLDDYVTFYKERGYDRFAIERSAEKLRDFYRLNGFLKTTVEPEVEKNDQEINITFNLNEGPKTRLKKVVFTGNKSFSHGKLLKVMTSQEHTITKQGFYREELILLDIDRLPQFYYDNGFFDAKIVRWETVLNEFEDQATVHIKIDEGESYPVNSINIIGNQLFTTKLLLKKSDLKIGKRYNQSDVNEAKDKILKRYRKKGYAYADIDVEKDTESTPKSVALTLNVHEGGEVRIGRIILRGQYNTKEKVIRNALKIKSGELYQHKKILNAQLNLKQLGIFDHVRVTPEGLEEKRKILDLIIKTQERKSLTVDIQAGFDSDKLGSGQLIITKRNIFGLAKQIQLRAIGGFELNRGEVTFYSPRFFGAGWNLIIQGFAEYEDDENFNATSFGGSIGGLKHFGPHWSLLLKTEIARFNIFESESNQKALKKNLFDNTFAEFLISLVYDTRDNYADPQRGVYTLLSTEFNTDLTNAHNNFNISELNIAYYIGFLKRFTLINTVRVGKLFRINQASRIPANKLFFMGGNDTIRGFDEDAINSSGGTTSLIYNLELHFRLYDAIKLAGFFDTGSLTETFSQISSSSFRQSAGFGLRYVTPVGPIRLDYGFVLDQKPGEKGQRFHFSFGYFF